MNHQIYSDLSNIKSNESGINQTIYTYFMIYGPSFVKDKESLIKTQILMMPPQEKKSLEIEIYENKECQKEIGRIAMDLINRFLIH